MKGTETYIAVIHNENERCIQTMQPPTRPTIDRFTPIHTQALTFEIYLPTRINREVLFMRKSLILSRE